MHSERMSRHTGSLLSVGMFLGGLVGLAMLVLFLPGAYQNYQAYRWPTTAGVVVASGTVVRDAGLGRPGNHPVAGPGVRYHYTVAGRDYESATVSFVRPSFASPSIYTPSVERRYPTGAKVVVAYDPLRPSVAVLDTKLPVGRLAVAIVLIALFGGYQVWLRRQPVRDA